MKCKEAIDLMTDVIEGALPATIRLAFDCHLAACRPCSLYLSQVRATIELTATLRDASKPEAGFHRKMLHRANDR